jgi:hypothetical protein
MPFIISPAVAITETDLTTIVPAVSVTVAAIAADFQWGPCYKPMLIDSEQTLLSTFWKPNDRTFVDFFTADNFLQYGNALQTVRIVNTTNANTALQGRNACSANSSGVQVLNDEQYVHSYLDGTLDSTYHAGEWIAAYPGLMGNSLAVYSCPTTNAYSRTLTGTLTANAYSAIVRGTGTAFTNQVTVGDYLRLNGETRQVATVANSSYLTLATSHISGSTSVNTAIRYWQFYNSFNGAPGTSDYATARSSSNDEMHICVTDKDGRWSGTPGTILETFPFVSKAADAKYHDGTTAYYRDVVQTQSKYVRWASHAATATYAGVSIAASGATTFGGSLRPLAYPLRGGRDGAVPTNAEKIRGYDMFADPEDIDVTLLLGAATDTTLGNYLIQNICESRLDCVAFISPPQSYVVNNAGNEATSCETYRNTLTSSSRGFLDSNWKYQYDKFNDTYRWVPCNGDTAGLMARTANLQDPWWSPAGYNRGLIKNVTKLAWNPRRAYRDALYRVSINPIIIDQGSGALLLGDKTLLAKPSSFGYINVRMLFIVLEKAIATASKFQLFEFNDEFSWAAFRNMVDPYLRDIKARRGIKNFKVICDATNNTPQVINEGGFIGDIYVLPNRSTQWVLLNFIAVREGVSFSEITGQA